MNYLFLECMNKLSVPIQKNRYISKLSNNELVGQLLHEAFRNTAEHAYLTVDGQIPKKGLRSISFHIISVDKNRFSEISPFNSTRPEIFDYFEKFASRQRKNARKNIDILEISILDSGPGFAETMRQSKPVGTDDTELVKHCFINSESRKLGENSGWGLHRILAAVKELHGFVRIRTSTCEVSFNTFDKPDENSNLVPNIEGNLENVVGTLLTVGIPIAY